MEKFRVISDSVSGRNGRVYKFGDEISEENLPNGDAKPLVTKKFIEPIVSDKIDYFPKNKKDKKST